MKDIVARPLGKTTGKAGFATIQVDDKKATYGTKMPKNGSGDNLSTLSQSPPLGLDGE